MQLLPPLILLFSFPLLLILVNIHTGRLRPLFELLLKRLPSSGNREVGHERDGAQKAVEVYARPGPNGAAELENKEGGDGEGEGELGSQPRGEVVVLLRGQGMVGPRIEEEGADIATEI